MKFVFWQNIISIHQSAFLNALSEQHDITLVVEKDIEDERKAQGWEIPGLEQVKIIIAPTEIEIYALLDTSAIHVFSGMYAYPMVSKVFRYAVKNGLKKGVMLEPFNGNGFTGKIRWIKYYLLKLRFSNSVDFMLPTGELGALQYQHIGFNKKKIFEWGYFVELSDSLISNKIKQKSTQKPSILFVGSIDERKNILSHIDIIIKHEKLISKMTIVGDGPLVSQLLKKVDECKVFDYKGNLPNNVVRELMQSHDILILPSKFDGWGAVVNEALIAGIQVIASENCGASVLLDGEIRGEKFVFMGKKDFETVLLKWIHKGLLSSEHRKLISDWSEQHISGKVAAAYFEQIIGHIYFNKPEKPLAPWRG